MIIVGYLVCGIAMLLGCVVIVCPQQTLEQQVQLHEQLKWKLDVSNLQRELLRIKIAGIIIITAALTGIYFTYTMRTFFEEIIFMI